jgi:hypothetical protein
MPVLSNLFSPVAKARQFYVYVLRDPRDGTPFYVGKGAGSRSRQHLADYRAGRILNAAKFARIDEIVKCGEEPTVEIAFSDLSERQALALEIRLIRDIGWKNLTNILPGSLGPKERMIAWAREMLKVVKPFAKWCSERSPSNFEKALFRRVHQELFMMARGERCQVLVRALPACLRRADGGA